MCAVDFGLAHRIPTEIIDLPFDSTGALKVSIMKCHEHTVAGEVNIGLEKGVTKINGMLKCVERVFGCFAHAASMSKCKHTLPVKKRVWSGWPSCSH